MLTKQNPQHAQGTGQNLSGTRAGTIQRGAKTFFEKKNREAVTFFQKIFFREKKRGARTFFREKIGGAKSFFSQYFEN